MGKEERERIEELERKVKDIERAARKNKRVDAVSPHRYDKQDWHDIVKEREKKHPPVTLGSV